MTTREFRIEFDTLYDNITSGAAPGLDDYERSYFLSKAQDELVKTWYDKRFEQSERIRRTLDNLVSTTSTTKIGTGERFITETELFSLPDDVQYILAERVELPDSTSIYVKPIKVDDINIAINNPFQRPSVKRIEKFALRLDRGLEGNTRVVELLLFDSDIEKYIVRYLRKPKAIILSDLTEIGGGLSIEGETNETQCELDSSVHRDIIDRAVELALEAFEQQRLQTKVQLNERLN